MSEPPPAPSIAAVRRYLGLSAPDPRLGAAETGPTREGDALAVAVDTMVEGVHFPAETAPRDLGHKCLAVNLSDLAAMGAAPAAALLSLCLPRVDRAWLTEFGTGFRALAERYHVAVNGAEIVPGPLTVTVQVTGHVPPDRALRRRGARPGDRIYVTGHLGDAGMGLSLRQRRRRAMPADRTYLGRRLDRPTPRVEVGLAIRDLATAAIDISDGFAADLAHLAESSGVGATVHLRDLPLSPALRATAAPGEAVDLALSAGDDYELCFTAAAGVETELHRRLEPLAGTVTAVGVVAARPGIRFIGRDGAGVRPRPGYRHFRD